MKQSLRIATRKSPLALWQSNYVKNLLLQHYPDLQISLVQMNTQGDEILDTSLSKIGGKGLFIKELEQGISRGDADIAVHSLKDIPYELPKGFALGAILKREQPSDSLVSNNYHTLAELPVGAIVGTCSNRRIIQLKSLRPDITIKDLRGNIHTRLTKLDNNEYDAIILASAGLFRLGLENRISQQLSFYESLPAVGQGAVAIEILEADDEMAVLLKPLQHKITFIETQCERRINTRLMGNCSASIAIFAKINGDIINIKALIGSVVSNSMICSSISGATESWKELADTLVQRLIDLGAQELLHND